MAVPTSLHFEVGCALIERGIHVLMEKPITSTLDQAEKLVELAAKKGVVLAVGHIERFNPAVSGAPPSPERRHGRAHLQGVRAAPEPLPAAHP